MRGIGNNAVFTDIMDMDAESIIGLYKKRNRVEHCFRTINAVDMAFSMYRWSLQKIRVHMLFSLMRMVLKPVMELYLATVLEVVSTIKIVYITRKKNISVKLSSGDERAMMVMEKFNLEKLI